MKRSCRASQAGDDKDHKMTDLKDILRQLNHNLNTLQQRNHTLTIVTTVITLCLITTCGSSSADKVPARSPTSTPVVTEPEATIPVQDVDAVAWSPDGAWLALGGEGAVFLYTVNSLIDPTHVLTVPGDVESVAFSPDSRLIASGNRSLTSENEEREAETVRLWEVATGEPLSVWGTDSGAVYKVVFSPDGTTLASAHYDGTIRLWEVATGKRRTLEHGQWLTSLAFNRNGRRLASAGKDEHIRVWNVDTGQVITSLPTAPGKFTVVAFSPKRNLLAGTSHPNIEIYDLETGQYLIKISRQPDVFDLAFSPDGTKLASGSYRQTLRLWDLETGQELAVFPQDNVTSLAFSPAGQRLLTSGLKQPVHIWNVADALQKLENPP